MAFNEHRITVTRAIELFLPAAKGFSMFSSFMKLRIVGSFFFAAFC